METITNTHLSRELLYARLVGVQVDVARLREHYQTVVAALPSTPYRDNQVDYVGWAVTSRDGTLVDGVSRIQPQKGGVRGRRETEICRGYLQEVMRMLEQAGVSCYRSRIMKLENEGTEMGWHTDANEETWRLHIPIITNPSAFFEWQLPGGRLESLHLPADGSAWLVRVDITHRAVNRSRQPAERVHFLTGLNKTPQRERFGEPCRLVAYRPS